MWRTGIGSCPKGRKARHESCWGSTTSELDDRQVVVSVVEVRALAQAAGVVMPAHCFQQYDVSSAWRSSVQLHNLVKGFRLSCVPTLQPAWLSRGRCPSAGLGYLALLGKSACLHIHRLLVVGPGVSKVRQWLGCALQASGKVPVPTLALGCRHPLFLLVFLSLCHPFASLLPQNASWVL